VFVILRNVAVFVLFPVCDKTLEYLPIKNNLNVRHLPFSDGEINKEDSFLCPLRSILLISFSLSVQMLGCYFK
jgi:hypothetical protein